MMFQILMLAAGLALLTAGAEWLVRGAISLANRFGMPPLLIGLTVVGFGTSMPELLVSLQAALGGAPAIAVGNVVGSNTANILLILGVAAAISPIAATGAGLWRDLSMMLLAAALMLGLGHWGLVGREAGVALAVALITYLVWVIRTDRNQTGAGTNEDEADLTKRMSRWKEAAALIGGLAGLFVGADLLIDAATAIARAYSVSEAVIGLTIVAVGTSLPELATSVVAAFRRQSAIALGNVVGSNIFNILGILGVTAIFVPVPVADSFVRLDIPFMLGASLALGALIVLRGSIGRAAGLAMLTVYASYVIWMF